MRTRLKRMLRRWLRPGEAAREEYPALPYLDPGLVAAFPRRPVALYETPIGRYVLPTDAPDDVIAYEIRRGKVFEPGIVALAARHIVPGTVALDVGSNFGQMGVEFARMAGPAGRVHCFEANDFVHALLVRNLGLNGVANAVPHFGAVWHESGKELVFPDPDFKRFSSYGSFGVDPRAAAGKRVPTLRLDDVDMGGRVSFIKVDIQGSDLFALRGARGLILRDRPVIVFEYDKRMQKAFGTSFADYAAFIDGIGYAVTGRLDGLNFVIRPRESPV